MDRFISSRSNEPAKQLGQFLLFQGKITETQLKRAFEVHMQSQHHSGPGARQEGLVTNEDLEAALVARTREVIYDLFLWEGGYFHFAANGYDLKDLILVKMDINALIFRGSCGARMNGPEFAVYFRTTMSWLAQRPRDQPQAPRPHAFAKETAIPF